MRHLTGRDAVATILVAAIAVPYIGYLINGSMPFVQDPTGMAGIRSRSRQQEQQGEGERGT
jgi:hypothetical protein